MPELNIWLNIKRSFFAVWQSYQGLGLVGAMAHATDLVRQLIILPFTYILPLNTIRYLWHFSMLFLGTLSFYYFLRKFLKTNKFIAFSTALFYLLNFGTIQIFYAPFEPFSTFFGFFPLLIFSLVQVYEKPNRHNFIVFVLINFLATPSFYVQTIFFVYFICLSLIAFSYRKKIKTKTIFNTFLIILLLNSFWLLPQAYYLKNHIKEPQLAFGNIMATSETIARNQARGTPLDFLLLRGYYYDFPDIGGSLMSAWHTHLEKPFILSLGLFLSLFFLIGLFTYIFNHKKLSHFYTVSFYLLILSLFTYLSITNQFLASIPIISQIFRSPFTKFIIPTVFSYSIFVALGLQQIKSPLIYSFPLALLIFSFPSFTGNFIYPKLRQPIPAEYFSLFNYFQTQNPKARIANLPSGNFWGWTNYRTGIRGSGFLWYAIPQPILDRAFDVWNLKNEAYYWQLSQALSKQDPLLVESILKKYYIEYVIFDNNIYFPDEKIFGRIALKNQDLLKEVPNLTFIQKFGNISVYKYPKQATIITNPIDTKLPEFLYSDPINQPYISTPNSPVNYSNLNLFSNRFPYSQKPQISSEFLEVQVVNKELISNQTDHLLGISFPNLALNQSYLAQIDYKNKSGMPLEISIFSSNFDHLYLKSKLDPKQEKAYVLIPKLENTEFNKGIVLLFNNPQFTRSISRNLINTIKIDQINLDATLFAHTSLIKSEKKYYVLPQSFEPGWISYPKTNHVLVNNWANGFEISNNTYYIFWPQILQFIGFALIALILRLLPRRSL